METAPAEPLQLVPVAVVLADALEPLGEHPHHLARVEQPLRVRVAGQGRAALAGELGEHRDPEHQVRPEQTHVPVGRGLVVHRHREHQGVDRNRAGVVGDEQRRAVGGQVMRPDHLDPEIVPVEQAQQRVEDGIGQLGVEAELVHLVAPGQPATQEREQVGDPLLPVVGLRGVVHPRRLPGRTGASAVGPRRALRPGPRSALRRGHPALGPGRAVLGRLGLLPGGHRRHGGGGRTAAAAVGAVGRVGPRGTVGRGRRTPTPYGRPVPRGRRRCLPRPGHRVTSARD